MAKCKKTPKRDNKLYPCVREKGHTGHCKPDLTKPIGECKEIDPYDTVIGVPTDTGAERVLRSLPAITEGTKLLPVADFVDKLHKYLDARQQLEAAWCLIVADPLEMSLDTFLLNLTEKFGGRPC